MSLIVDINPVPWKILELVKARILKNRAKKENKGLDWSRESLKREMALQPMKPGPLLSKRRDEPSFVSSPRLLTFTIEGKRTSGNQSTVAEWKIYCQDEEQKGTPSKSLHVSAMIGIGQERGYFEYAPFIYNPRNLIFKLYVSFFADLGSGDSMSPVIVSISSATVDAYDLNNLTIGYQWTKSFAELWVNPLIQQNFTDEELAEAVRRLTEIAENESFNPLHNWPDPKTFVGTIFYNVVNRVRPPATQTALPLAKEFDQSRIAQIPGYIKTVALELTETSDQFVSITVDP
jgi:hypothetical protein